MTTLILFNKPYGVLSQFRHDDNNDYGTLSAYFSDKSLRVAGRLDATSEGLLLLTNDGQLNKALTHPPKANNQKKQGKTYWIQVAGHATDAQLHELAQGVLLKDGMTLPAKVARLTDEQVQPLWQAPDNIAKRKVTTWLEITIVEGKNRQVRRMAAQVGLPCLRLVRVATSGFGVFDLAVGEAKMVTVSAQLLQQLGVLPSSRAALPRRAADPTKTRQPPHNRGDNRGDNRVNSRINSRNGQSSLHKRRKQP